MSHPATQPLPTPLLAREAGYRARDKYRRRPVFLWDRAGDLGDVNFIDCTTGDLSQIDRYDPGETVFVFAFSDNTAGVPFARRIQDLQLPHFRMDLEIPPLFADKATPTLVADAMRVAQAKVKGRRAVVLWDGYGAVGEVEHVDCSKTSPTALDAYDMEKIVFVYACTQDDIGTPFIRHIHERGGKYYPIRYHQPALFVNLDTVARTALEKEFVHQKEAGFAKWDHGPHDFIGLIQALEITRDVRGDYVEVGCYRGSSGGAVLRYLRDKGRSRTCHFLDVFEGFDYEEARSSADALWAGTHQTEGLEAIRRRLESYAENVSSLKVFVHKANIITEPLPAEIKSIAVANLDVDLYEAVLAGLRRLAPLIAPNGVLVVEDPGHSPFLVGARVALDEFLEQGGRELFIPIYMNSGQTFLIRKAGRTLGARLRTWFRRRLPTTAR